MNRGISAKSSISYIKSSSGNTRKKIKKKQISPAKHWCWTFNNHDLNDICNILDISSKVAEKYVFQQEIGQISGIRHLQGYIKFYEKCRPFNVFKSKKIHWERCKKPPNSIKYCSKHETRIPNTKVYSKGIKFPKKILILDESSLFKWQKKIINIITLPTCSRSIYWFWETIGNTGKSVFCKYLCVKHDALILSGKASDMKYGLVQYMSKHDGCSPEIICLDIPRSCEKYLSYTGIEEIKNGCFFSSKYESEMVIYNSPHIIIFSNFKPQKQKLSKDRWLIFNIHDNESWNTNSDSDGSISTPSNSECGSVCELDN